jgi:hypothetical protein
LAGIDWYGNIDIDKAERRTISYNPNESFVFVLPRSTAAVGQPGGIDPQELERICRRQLRQQGLWMKYLPSFDLEGDFSGESD